MLKIENLHVSYGGIQALRGISLEVPDGKIVTLIGANGAGKSTTLNTVCGLLRSRTGSIEFLDKNLASVPPHKVVELGKDVAMQICAMNPTYLDKSNVSQEVLDKEKEIQLAIMANDPKMAAKPDKVKEGIVMGKLGKYYEENCLLQQAFVKENKTSVEKHVAAVAKELGGSITVKAFTRFATGEGIEKKEDDFAAEVASMIK